MVENLLTNAYKEYRYFNYYISPEVRYYLPLNLNNNKLFYNNNLYVGMGTNFTFIYGINFAAYLNLGNQITFSNHFFIDANIRLYLNDDLYLLGLSPSVMSSQYCRI